MIFAVLFILIVVFLVYCLTRPTVLVLKYHHINPLPETNLNYTPETFARQIDILIERGYSGITLDEMYDQVYQKKRVKPRQFVITFDDGFVDNFLYAFPVLQKYNLKATIFLTTSNIIDSTEIRTIQTARIVDNNQAFIDAIHGDPGSFLTWTEIRQMHESGLVDFEPHGHYHKYIYISSNIEYYTIGHALLNSFKLTSLEDPQIVMGSDVYDSGPSLGYKKYNPYTKDRETDWQAYKRFVEEIDLSKQMIEKTLDKHCHYFSWPWGKFCNLSLQAAKYLGFRMICTSFPGANFIFTRHTHIKRFNPSLDPTEFRRQITKFSSVPRSIFNR